MEENKSSSNRYLVGCLTGFAIGTFVAMLVVVIVQLVMRVPYNLNSNDNADISDLTQKMQLIISEIDKTYIDEIDEEEMEDAVYGAILESLDDPYSCYYNEEELTSMLDDVAGTYCGIGVSVNKDAKTQDVVVTNVFKSGSAHEAGIKAGDKILCIDGNDVKGQSLDMVVSWVKGEEGTEVTVKVDRDGKKIDFIMNRKMIEVDTVYYEMLEDNIGYIQLKEFDVISITQFSEAVDDLNSQGMEKIIVDVRDNPGGRMDVVCDIVNTFLEKDKLILYTEDKYGDRVEQYTDKDGKLIGIPLVVLVNENSASASEVFSGVIKDYDAGMIVGKTTFGKGVVQKLVRLSDGTALKLTYSKYYTPAGEEIHGKGIEPVEEVELPGDKKSPTLLEENEKDTQLEKAIELLK
ncbi:MAG: S41 family peptidase [Lachnospiraceae bacterium]|nr:S41 family peptidase [Lachnospiraceae bacterium]